MTDSWIPDPAAEPEALAEFAVLCLARYLIAQRATRGSSVGILPGRLAPHRSIGERLLRRVSSMEPLDKIAGFSQQRASVDESEEIVRFRIYNPELLHTFADAMEAYLADYFRSDAGSIEAAMLWQELVTGEASEYLELRLLEQGFDPRWELELREELDALASYFSAGELFNLCWVAVREGASQHVKSNGNAHLVVIAIRSSIRKRAAMTVDGKYELKPYNRHHYSVPSTAARILSETLTTLGPAEYVEAKPWSGTVLSHAKRSPKKSRAQDVTSPETLQTS